MGSTPAADLYRWQAATGAMAGALVADAVVNDADQWSDRAARSLVYAEDLIRGDPTPIDLAPVDAVPAAVGFSAGASPLLFDGATVELIDLVRASLRRETLDDPKDELLSTASELGRRHDRFHDVVDASGSLGEAVLGAAFFGLRHGLGAIPARLVSTITGPDRRRGRRHVGRLTDRLLGLDRLDWYDAPHRRGPKEVLPGVWLANILALNAFVKRHPDGLVLSLCDIEGRLADHPHQITFHIDDTPKRDSNPSLSMVVDDVMSEVAAARLRGQPVLVHCRHGASRTGLVLRLLLMHEYDLDPEAALMEAQTLWRHTSTWNHTWTRELERRAASG